MKEKKKNTDIQNKDKTKKEGKKDKILFGAALLVILAVSIWTANINMQEKVSTFFKTIWNNGQEAVKEAQNVKTLSKGAHAEIKNTQTAHLVEIYQVLGKEMDEQQAVAVLQEVKTLAYHGKRQGVSASSKEIDSCISTIKQKLKDADQSQYNRMVKRYGDEDDYWTILEEEVREYVVSEKVKEEKRAELKKKKDVDVEKELQEYLDEIVGYENFQKIN